MVRVKWSDLDWNGPSDGAQPRMKTFAEIIAYHENSQYQCNFSTKITALISDQIVEEIDKQVTEELLKICQTGTSYEKLV